MAGVKEMIDQKIREKKVMVFARTSCPFCAKAKHVFDKYRRSRLLRTDQYEIMALEKERNADVILANLKIKTGARTVPRVFVNGKCIGGGDETVRLDQSGQLRKMLEDGNEDETPTDWQRAAGSDQQKVARKH